MAEEIKHFRPHETARRAHTITIEKDGKEIGFAELIYYGAPLPLYHLLNLDVEKKSQGKRYGSKLMAKIEALLVAKGKAGVVEDGIAPNSMARGMYARRGWRSIPDAPGWLAYNLPAGYDIRNLKEIASRLASKSQIARLAKFRNPGKP